MTTITLNERTAKAAGYRQLTSRFCLPDEEPLLNGVLADMRRGNISHVLVKDRVGVSVWRRGCTAGRRAAL
ncbi:MAG: hypothetical protein BWX68_02353 [Verrucomicrobia bacterium ADurb.Bin063]|nr:MAG: hypothetical protein BWX68_02353 [Verrucomicrobia bacterium ADurb.Bin063]